MSNGPIKPKLMPSAEESSGVMTAIGCLDVETKHGVVHFHDAPGFMTSLIHREGIETSIGVLVYTENYGLIMQVDAEVARSFAASLLRLADEIGPRRTH